MQTKHNIREKPEEIEDTKIDWCRHLVQLHMSSKIDNTATKPGMARSA
jgi:hypothetical protein